jgi:hypothetical protein
MTLKTKIIISVVALLTAFSFGRYSKNSPPEVKTKETINSETKIDQNKDTHTHTVTTTTKDKIVTVTDTDTVSKTDKDTHSITDLQQTVTPQKQSKVNISAIGAMDFSKSLPTPTYGLSFQKEFIGPITVGAFGLMNGVVGVSIGLDF